MAHGRLAETDARRRPCDAAFREQGIEMNKQVQVDSRLIDGIDGQDRFNLFDQ
jgi:hypothetical protein